MAIMERLDALSRHLPGHKTDDFDYEADARENHARMMGHTLTPQERRERALQMAGAPAHRLPKTG